MPDNFLEHYGVKGMKWGVRKTRGKGKKSSAKTAKTLTDKELNKRVKRLNLEKQYVDLSAGQSEKGKTLVKGMIKKAGKKKMQSLVNTAVSDLVDISLVEAGIKKRR